MRTRNLLGIMLGLLTSAWTAGVVAAPPLTVPAAANFPTPGRQTVPFGVPLAPPIYFVNFLFLYFAVRLGVHHGMRDFTRSEVARREQRP